MEALLHYINPAHAISLLSALNEDRLKGQLCDVVLIVGDHKFRAHKNVLAASSDYFQTLFTKKENENQSVFQLDLCEATAFENILNYIYSSSLFVEKKSLATVHDLGGKLGISFLTNIPSQTPQIPCPLNPSKKLRKILEDGNACQPRSVIVCQSRNDIDKNHIDSTGKGGDSNQKKGLAEEDGGHDLKSSSLMNVLRANSSVVPAATSRNMDESHPMDDNGQSHMHGPLGDTKRHDNFRSLEDRNSRMRFLWDRRNSMSVDSTSDFARNVSDTRQSLTDLLVNGNPGGRPQLSGAFSFHGTTVLPYPQHKAEQVVSASKVEESNLLYYTKVGHTIQSPRFQLNSQGVVNSGPLVKSLLRRSLSMDSQVPSYSSLDLKMNYGPHICKREPPELAYDASSQKPLNADSMKQRFVKDKPQVNQHCQPRQHSVSQPDTESASLPITLKIKTEPCSPVSDASDIIRVTVGETSPSTSKEFSVKNVERNRRTSMLPVKRTFQTENSKFSFEKSETFQGIQRSQSMVQRFEESAEGDNVDVVKTDENKDEYSECESAIMGKQFKCKTCFKIFRSTAGLLRHVDMYHNPDKPYACDICHKRFLTNFKVWTHCQTQHGVVINPSAATSSNPVSEERFQKKLSDMVREREIKKALFHKLRRKQVSHSYTVLRSEQGYKKNLRSATKGVYICTTCGKLFRFLSRYRQHMKTHPGEKPFVCKLYNKIFKSKEQGVDESLSDGKDHKCEHCNLKLSSVVEKTKHERICRNITVCSYCSLRFCSKELKQEHENQCEYKKLTCPECKRTFKTSFSIWRHQIEVHNENTMAPVEQSILEAMRVNGVLPKEETLQAEVEENSVASPSTSKEDAACSDSSEPMYVDSEDSSCFPEDLSVSSRRSTNTKDNPSESVSSNPTHLEDMAPESNSCSGDLEDLACKGERGLWPCEKCGKIFTIHKQLERHQELLCAVKPFICHVCHKAFRTNFRLWSHFQSHISQSANRLEFSKPSRSPSSHPLPPPPPPPPPPAPPQEQCPDHEQSSSHSDRTASPQPSETLFSHAPPLAAATFERPFMCKFCRRTFKTAFSQWSHEQTHN
uniref:Zinc finger and BTB domain containing 21 n=1 Tax=Callorhinchus milii TaxID=7868 RepID=A0A4W3IU08_CALMI|eukprot:gi/632976612/ref/XP_007904893.1/ PREDICTED: zinc finger and BTB domain-containing protein 21 [Callorhinchus milii]